MPEIREDEKVKELVDEITKKTRDLTEIVRVRVLQELIKRLQERLDQRPHPDQGLPKPQPTPPGETTPPEPTPT